MVEISHDIHSIDGLEHPFISSGIVSYLVEEGPKDLTLIDTCFVKDLPKLEKHLRNIGHSIDEINRIVLTHVHIDHIQAVNEIKKISGGHVKIYSHWIEAEYLASNPKYLGPPPMRPSCKYSKNMGLTLMT